MVSVRHRGWSAVLRGAAIPLVLAVTTPSIVTVQPANAVNSANKVGPERQALIDQLATLEKRIAGLKVGH
jgi:hypothetical protein